MAPELDDDERHTDLFMMYESKRGKLRKVTLRCYKRSTVRADLTVDQRIRLSNVTLYGGDASPCVTI